jgi:SP family sugar:H+ symporter-like MFS transporter
MRRATYIGLIMAVLQQLTGVNIIYFYSNQILNNCGIDAGTATLLVQGFSLLGVLMGIVITGYVGRKTIMFWSSLIMSALLIGTGISL